MTDTKHLRESPQLPLTRSHFMDGLARLHHHSNSQPMHFQIEQQMLILLGNDSGLPAWVFDLAADGAEQVVNVATHLDRSPMINLTTWNTGGVGRIPDHLTWGILGIVSGGEKSPCWSCICQGHEADRFSTCALAQEEALSVGDTHRKDANHIHQGIDAAENKRMKGVIRNMMCNETMTGFVKTKLLASYRRSTLCQQHI